MNMYKLILTTALAFFVSSCSQRVKTTAYYNSFNPGLASPAKVNFSANNQINVKDYGAIGNGAANDTAALSAAAKAVTTSPGKTIFFPEGIYLTDGLSLLENSHVLGSHQAILKGRGGSNNVLTLASGVKIENLQVDGNENIMSGGNAISGQSVAGVQITGTYIHNCKDKCIQIANSTNFLLSNNRIENAAHQCIEIDFSSNGIVSGNSIDTCAHGIQWWGGDAATNSRPGVSDLLISGNTLKNMGVGPAGFVGGGGIWGSLGERITITGNEVENCKDVCIDTEGGIDNKITGNTVTNGKNTAIGTFYGSSNITISGNKIHQDRDFGNGIHIHSGPNKVSSHLNISNNTIHTTNSQGISTDQNALIYSLIQNNDITVDSTEKGLRILEGTQVDILGNQIHVAVPTAISFEGPSDSLIANNIVETSDDNSTPGGLNGGIFVYWRSSTFPAKRNIIKGNTIRGFVTSINDNCWGDLNSDTRIEGNRLDTIYRPRGSWSGLAELNISLSNPNITIIPTNY